MPITINCPQCSKRLSAPDAASGKTLKCPKCMAAIVVPFLAAPVPPVSVQKPPLPPEPQDRKKRCPLCGEMIAEIAIKCRFCNSMLVPVHTGQGNLPSASGLKLIYPSRPPKDPVLMALLSGCCIAGLGQMVLGQAVKGVVVLIGAMALGALTAGLSVFVTWPLMGVDAYLVAKKLRSGQPVTEWESFPS